MVHTSAHACTLTHIYFCKAGLDLIPAENFMLFSHVCLQIVQLSTMTSTSGKICVVAAGGETL